MPVPERQWAYTPPGANYPPFVNVMENLDGSFTITVRSSIKENGSCGDIASMTMSDAEFLVLLRTISDALIQ
jgi:hypothetical protein